MEIKSLIERIEKSEGADRRLDAKIALLCDPEFDGWIEHPANNENQYGELAPSREEFDDWLIRDGKPCLRSAPAFSSSMDAVRSLIDPADEWELTTLYGVARATVGLNRDHQTAWPGYGEHEGGDPVRALLSAALKARNPSQ